MAQLAFAAFHDPVISVCLAALVLIAIAALASPLVAPFDPNHQVLGQRLDQPFAPSGTVSILGADPLGRDIFSRLIFGARVSLVVAVTAVGAAGIFGVLVGLLAGYYGRRVDAILMRITDTQFSIPFLVLALGLAAVIPRGLGAIIVILAITGWPRFARVLRAEALRVMALEFIEAARMVGGTDQHIIRRHVLPNVVGIAFVLATAQVGQTILAEASLSFLGVGVPSDIPSWGAMVADGRDYLSTSWWVSAFPGIAILVTVLALNLVGDWLIDYADPVVRQP